MKEVKKGISKIWGSYIIFSERRSFSMKMQVKFGLDSQHTLKVFCRNLEWIRHIVNFGLLYGKQGSSMTIGYSDVDWVGVTSFWPYPNSVVSCLIQTASCAALTTLVLHMTVCFVFCCCFLLLQLAAHPPI